MRRVLDHLIPLASTSAKTSAGCNVDVERIVDAINKFFMS